MQCPRLPRSAPRRRRPCRRQGPERALRSGKASSGSSADEARQCRVLIATTASPRCSRHGSRLNRLAKIRAAAGTRPPLGEAAIDGTEIVPSSRPPARAMREEPRLPVDRLLPGSVPSGARRSGGALVADRRARPEAGGLAGVQAREGLLVERLGRPQTILLLEAGECGSGIGVHHPVGRSIVQTCRAQLLLRRFDLVGAEILPRLREILPLHALLTQIRNPMS